jgi:N-acetylglucosamine-6-phosphate deacetylase
MHTRVTADRLWDGTTLHTKPRIDIEGGRMVSIGSAAQSSNEALRFPSATLASAFFDVHIHGACGHDAMEATPGALASIGRFLAAHGTATFLPTTVTAPLDAILRSVSALAALIRNPRLIAECAAGEPIALPVGIHLEGPFLSHLKRGVQPEEHLLAPDPALFDRIFEAAEGQIRLMTLAPELPGALELIAHATRRGVRVSLGHSNATAAETRAAIATGAVSATHTFNAMRPLDHREPGIAGTVLADDSVFAELISDGIHVAPEIVRLWARAKGPARGILVTDSISAAGMPDGEYSLGGFPVQVSGGRATARGVLAGSTLTLDRALENFLAFTGWPLEQALPLLTTNPAALAGLSGQLGSIAVGRSANIVALDPAGRLVASILDGKLAPGIPVDRRPISQRRL